MYRCKNCGHYFAEPEILFDKHGLTSPPYEKRMACPNCHESSLAEKASHCRCCGARISKDMQFCCEACRKRAEMLWDREKKRKRTEEPINRILRKKEAYNRRHGTHYSYGQYTALKEKNDVRG